MRGLPAAGARGRRLSLSPFPGGSAEALGAPSALASVRRQSSPPHPAWGSGDRNFSASGSSRAPAPASPAAAWQAFKNGPRGLEGLGRRLLPGAAKRGSPAAGEMGRAASPSSAAAPSSPPSPRVLVAGRGRSAPEAACRSGRSSVGRPPQQSPRETKGGSAAVGPGRDGGGERRRWWYLSLASRNGPSYVRWWRKTY